MVDYRSSSEALSPTLLEMRELDMEHVSLNITQGVDVLVADVRLRYGHLREDKPITVRPGGHGLSLY